MIDKILTFNVSSEVGKEKYGKSAVGNNHTHTELIRQKEVLTLLRSAHYNWWEIFSVREVEKHDESMLRKRSGF